MNNNPAENQPDLSKYFKGITFKNCVFENCTVDGVPLEDYKNIPEGILIKKDGEVYQPNRNLTVTEISENKNPLLKWSIFVVLILLIILFFTII